MTIVAISRTLKVMLDMTVPSLGTLAATRPVSVRNQAPRRWDLHGLVMRESLRILESDTTPDSMTEDGIEKAFDVCTPLLNFKLSVFTV